MLVSQNIEREGLAIVVENALSWAVIRLGVRIRTGKAEYEAKTGVSVTRKNIPSVRLPTGEPEPRSRKGF